MNDSTPIAHDARLLADRGDDCAGRVGPASAGLDRRRRRLLRGAAALAVVAPARLSLAGAGAEDRPRLVFAILRGGADGLAFAPPVGDPDLSAARGPLAAFAAPPLPLAGRYALHPALRETHASYGRGELILLHAVGIPYRERSHFDAQQVLESGGRRPYELDTGWLGRAHAAGARAGGGIALSPAVPLALRGAASVDTWAPSRLAPPEPDLVLRLGQMYDGDRALAQALERAVALRAGDGATRPVDPAMGAGRGDFVALCRKAAEFLAAPRGAAAAVLELGGWDTHANQDLPRGPLARNLEALDAGLAALRDGLGTPAWRRTVVLVATEFGRQVEMNGTRGSDHGSGGAALVLGGAVRGGRVHADWPGLSPAARLEGRDLRTTTDLRAAIMGIVGPHLGVGRAALTGHVLPGTAGLAPLDLLA